MALPATKPKVAEAIATDVAPSTPIAFIVGPKAPALPWPPTMGMDPVHRESKGGTFNNLPIPRAIMFWQIIKQAIRTRNINICFPPCFNGFIEAL